MNYTNQTRGNNNKTNLGFAVRQTQRKERRQTAKPVALLLGL
jgi:hypothetical protein